MTSIFMFHCRLLLAARNRATSIIASLSGVCDLVVVVGFAVIVAVVIIAFVITIILMIVLIKGTDDHRPVGQGDLDILFGSVRRQDFEFHDTVARGLIIKLGSGDLAAVPGLDIRHDGGDFGIGHQKLLQFLGLVFIRIPGGKGHGTREDRQTNQARRSSERDFIAFHIHLLDVQGGVIPSDERNLGCHIRDRLTGGLHDCEVRMACKRWRVVLVILPPRGRVTGKAAQIVEDYKSV
ncbi:MAG: hypothetical protein KDK00_15755 [Rhodobacteraceae bacterium]|nr:hypothetical protein [Paracoccaceae bacterium]